MSRSDIAKRVQRQMRNERPALSPLGDYLNWMRNQGKEGAESAEVLSADIIETFTTDEGLRVLKLFEKAVLQVGQPNGSSDSALRELNAVRNFVLEIRRIVAHE